MTRNTDVNAAFSGPNIVISAQYIKDLSFESPNAPQIFAAGPEHHPDMQMGVNILTRTLAENTYEVVLANKMETRIDNRTAFIVELAYAGIFSLPPLDEDVIKKTLLINCPQLLFPFARSIIMSILRDSGFPQVMINPIDFAELYEQNQESAAA